MDGYERVADDEDEADSPDEDEIDREAQEADAVGDIATELDLLKEEAALCEKKEMAAQSQLNSLNVFWEKKAKDLEQYIETESVKRAAAEDKIEALEHPPEPDEPIRMTGPECLSWVRHPRFAAVCSFVVCLNLVTMFMEMAHPHYKEDFWFLDQAVLIFYIAELFLKALVYQRDLLLGPCLVVWWNWLDLVIVIAAILDQWLQPLISTLIIDANGSSGTKQSQLVQVIKFLRIARLARILKTVRAFMQSDLSWTNGSHFQLFIMGTIAANSIIMSFESDYPDWGGWFYVEQVLLIIFTFELMVRIKYAGCQFFIDPKDIAWNWLDLTIVAGGIVDEWMMPLFKIVQKVLGTESKTEFDIGEVMTTLRLARLLRILRLVRLVKNVPPLFTLIVGILQAMQGMAWVLVLTAVFLYAFALLGVRLVGHGLLFGGRAPPDVAEIFPTVPQSMFVLFKVMNGDTDQIEPLFEALPLSKLVCVLYMVVSSWAILSILTAVVSENMINATEKHREETEGETTENEELHRREFLKHALAQVDVNGDGCIDSDELDAILNDEATLDLLVRMTNAASPNLAKRDLREVYNLLRSTDKVSSDAFVEALRTEKNTVTERSMMRLEQRLINLQNGFDMQLGHFNTGHVPSAPSNIVAGATSMHGILPAETSPSELARHLEPMLERMFAKFEQRLERRTREMSDLVNTKLGNGSSSGATAYTSLSTLDLPSNSSIEASLSRIEEQVDMNRQLLDRSQKECTLSACVTKLERQNVDLKKLIYESIAEGSNLRKSIGRIEGQLHRGTGLYLHDASAELSALETAMQRIDRQLGSNGVTAEPCRSQSGEGTAPAGNVQGLLARPAAPTINSRGITADFGQPQSTEPGADETNGPGTKTPPLYRDSLSEEFAHNQDMRLLKS